MNLKAKLTLLCGMPMVGLVACVCASFFMTQAARKQIEHTLGESAVFADTARRMQIDVVQVQQFLSDISATRGQDGLDDGFAEAQKHRESFETSLGQFKQMYTTENDREHLGQIESLRQAFDNYYQVGKSMAEAYVKDGPSAGNKLMEGFDHAAEKLTDALDPFVKEQAAELNGDLTRVAALCARTTKWLIWGGTVLFILTILGAVRLGRSIALPIKTVASALAEGAARTAAVSNQVSGSSQFLAEGASEQAASLEETSATLEELANMTKRNAESAQQADDLAKQTSRAADKGAEDMLTMSRAMDGIKAASDDIAKIIKTIDEVAFQTNILALNAAVEAARAGEAGMGFAVVADEVRNLAQRSAQAAKETAGKIEGAITRTEQGVQISRQVSETLNDIVTKIRSVNQLVAEVATASREQAQGISQINTAVSQMDKVTQSNAANAEESASGAGELNSQAKALNDSVVQLIRLVDGETRRPATESRSQGPKKTKTKKLKVIETAAREQLVASEL